MALEAGWEGDIRHGSGPFVCPLPDGDCGSEYLIAWKQDNNGSTFIASPFCLPWLKRDNKHLCGTYHETEIMILARLSNKPKAKIIRLHTDGDPPEAA
jgi:hypothetical protein